MKRTKLSATAGAICALTLTMGATLPSIVQADDVTLRSPDGSISLTGELVSLQDGTYTIRTELADLRIAASRVTCIGDACPADKPATEQVAVVGSETIGLGLMPLLLEGYAAHIDAEVQPGDNINKTTSQTSLIADGGFGDELAHYSVNWIRSSSAFDALMEETAQIGMSSRRIQPVEARALRDTGAGNMISPDQEHIVAVDSLVVVTHPDNPVQTITMDQLANIYSGVIKNWSEVGGEDADILVIDRPERSGTRSVLAEVFKAALVATIAPLEVRIANDSVRAAQLVRENENAIGFLGYAFQRGTKALTLVDACDLPMVPDAFSARTEEYPLQRRLYLYNRADNLSGQARGFVDFATSPAADAFITKSGFIGLGIESRPQTADGERAAMLTDQDADPYEAPFMRDMYEQMLDYDRLSTTFRFRTASSKLDERGRIDMQRLIDYLSDQPAGTQVLLVGFTDDVGPFDNNLALSKERAQDAFDALLTAAGDRINQLNISATGFGEMAPSGCNLNDDGRRINRRVEVWIKRGST